MRKWLVYTLIILLFLPLVYAVDTPITVKTFPYHRVEIFILDTQSEVYKSLDSFYRDSGQSGEVSVTYSGDQPILDINLIIKVGDQIFYKQRFDDFTAGNPINLKALIKDETQTASPTLENLTENTTNQTLNETNLTVQTNETVENITLEEETSHPPSPIEEQATTTGKSISESRGRYSKIIYYVIAIIVIAIIVIVGVIRIKKKSSQNINVMSWEDKKKQMQGKEIQSIKTQIKNPELTRAELKLQKAQEEIIRLKNQDKITEIERRMDELKKDLEKLRG